MKHITWILFTVFCSAFLQVQPVTETKECPKCICCQCQVPASCGSPCSGATSPAPLVFAAQERASATRSVARRAVSAKPAEKKFYSSFAGAPSKTAALPRSATAEPAAAEPLFVVQCRILI